MIIVEKNSNLWSLPDLVLIITSLVPEIIQHEAAMHFRDEVGHIVHKSSAEDFIYRSVDGAKAQALEGASKTENHLSHKLSHRFKSLAFGYILTQSSMKKQPSLSTIGEDRSNISARDLLLKGFCLLFPLL
jgi:hypothetical protein